MLVLFHRLDRDHRARTTQFVAHNEKLVEGYDKEMARINGRKNDLDKQLISMEEKYRVCNITAVVDRLL